MGFLILLISAAYAVQCPQQQPVAVTEQDPLVRVPWTPPTPPIHLLYVDAAEIFRLGIRAQLMTHTNRRRRPASGSARPVGAAAGAAGFEPATARV
jgi:hypothetical protein